MRILFIGTVEFSYKSLEKLININTNIVGVCTKKNSNFNSDFVDITPLCIKNNIAFNYIDDINSKDSLTWIKEKKTDVIFCFGWSSLLKKDLINLAPMGVIGFHPTLLPFNRGRHPLIWALVLGLKKSASTFFFIEEGADTGDILSQEEFIIEYEDNAKILYDKVIQLALNQIEIFIPKLQNNTFNRIKQNNNLSNNWRKRNKLDGVIDFRMNSMAIYNLVRGLSKPYVGANIQYKGENIIFWKVEIVQTDLSNIEYGKILEVKNNTVLIKTYDNAVRVLEHTFKSLPKVGEYL